MTQYVAGSSPAGAAFYCGLAQLVEHLALNQVVAGSSPVSVAIAVCPGGEGVALKAIGLKRLAGSNPVCGAMRRKTQ